jgi:hypothetical protein
MLRYTSLLVSLVLLIDRLPWPSEPILRKIDSNFRGFLRCTVQ